MTGSLKSIQCEFVLRFCIVFRHVPWKGIVKGVGGGGGNVKQVG
jgi:hypothetical protein